MCCAVLLCCLALPGQSWIKKKFDGMGEQIDNLFKEVRAGVSCLMWQAVICQHFKLPGLQSLFEHLMLVTIPKESAHHLCRAASRRMLNTSQCRRFPRC